LSISRRRFVGFTAGAAAGTAIGMSAGKFLSDFASAVDSPVYVPRGPEGFTLSVCAMCPGGCGLRARRIGERAVKLEGNPLHPVNGGRLCPRGHAALQGLYHPDRAPGPLHRVGPRGSIGSFEPSTWDRAMDEIAGRLRSLREAKRPESLVLIRGSHGGIGLRVARRFVQAFGSPNDVALDRGEEAAALALLAGQGVRTAPAYDVQSTDYVLSLGGALLEAWSSPVHMTRAYGEFRQGRMGRRGKLVHVEPRLSVTASSADEWIAVRPGTEGVFALGLAGVIVSEDLHNRDFVLARTLGLEESHDAQGRVRPGLRALLERHYGLERVAGETGVSVNVILRIAREFAGARSSVAIGPRKGPLLPGQLFDHLAAQVLNALVGSLDTPGGVLVPEDVPLASWPALPADAAAAEGRKRPRIDGAGGKDFPLLGSDPERLADALISGSPYPAEVLMVVGADPLLTSAAPERFAAAIQKVPLVVSFATIPDDTALHADWILPEAHFLERWDLHTSPPGVPYPLVSLAQPVLAKPLRDARPVGEVFMDLARRVGPATSLALPWKDVPELIRTEMDALYEKRRGAIMGTQFDEAWVRMMEGAGWWAPGYRSADELWKRALESGGWWDPFYDHQDWKRVLRTESGRYEFRTDLLEGATQHVPTAAAPTPAVSAQQGTAPGPLALVLFEPLAIAGGTGAELPFLQGILDPGQEERWETWAEIHPESAAVLGVKDRQWVRVESPSGAILARARVGLRVVPGVVAIPVGLGKRGGGRWAKNAGANPLRLLVPARDPLSGLPDFGATTVRVSLAAAPGMARPPERS